MAFLGDCHSFGQFDTNLDRPGKRESQLRNCLHQIALWACLWGISLIVNKRPVDFRLYHSWAGGPGLNKRADWASHSEQASNSEHPSMASASVPALSFCFAFPWWWTVTCKPNKPFPPWVVVGQYFLTTLENKQGQSQRNLVLILWTMVHYYFYLVIIGQLSFSLYVSGTYILC